MHVFVVTSMSWKLSRYQDGSGITIIQFGTFMGLQTLQKERIAHASIMYLN